MALTFAMLALGVNTATADELAELKARNAQLEATVEELTLQLAETLSERKALEAQLADAVARLEAANAAGAAAATAAAATAVATAPEAPPAEMAAASAADTAPDEEVVEEAIVAEGVAAGAVTGTAAGANGPSSGDSLASSACDVDEALRGYKRSGKANRALGDWLQSANHLKVCSAEQLRYIRKAVKFDFLGYEKAVLAMIDEELEGR